MPVVEANPTTTSRSATKPHLQKLGHWSLIVAVNNDRVLRKTLFASPAIDAHCELITKPGFPSAGKAYNAGIAEAQHDVMVFAHQDVYLPSTWTMDLERALAHLTIHDPNWGVLGLVGVARNKVSGYCYSTGLRSMVGTPFAEPTEVESLDELLIIVRRSAGLRFDNHLPGFHFYGTDICLEARARDLKSYVIPAFCIHNSNGVRYFPIDFWRAYLYLRRKWRQRLPITTSCTKVTKFCAPALAAIGQDLLHQVLRRRNVGARVDDVAQLYQSLSGNHQVEA